METEIEWNDWFYLDATSPSYMRWKVDRLSGRNRCQKHVVAGDVAGCIGNHGYYAVKLNHVLYQVHRVIIELTGRKPHEDDFVDHIDGNKLNNAPSNLRVVKRVDNARNIKKRLDNRSGVTGVSRISNGQGCFYWSARCEGLDGDILQKRFPVKKHGEDEAFRLACEWRKKMIDQLNTQGAGYTERHGT